MMLLSLPARVDAESYQMNAGPPSISQQLVREGDFALKLGLALAVGAPQDEVEAEDLLTEVGVMPKNGWIADYPVTPDIIDELYKAVRDAAASNKIPMSVDVALQRLSDVMSQVGLSIATQSGGRTYSSAQLPGTQGSPSSTVINNYYQNEGPPTVTYYAPPPDYYYMYGWVPFTFWSAGIWFPGFFILNDFHRAVFIDNRVVFVSNHFNDVRRHRIVRIDPAARLNGSFITNTRVIHTRGGVSVVGPRRDRAIINEPRRHTVPNIGTVRPPARSYGVVSTPRNSDSVSPPPMRRGGTFSRPLRDDRTMSVPARSEVVVDTPFRGSAMSSSTSRSGGFASTPRSESSVFAPASGGNDFSMPSRDDRRISMPSRSGGPDRMPFRGNSGSGGRGRR
jgi:hypothetical protein